MNHLNLQHFRKLLLSLRDRVTNELPRLAETVRADARAPGEHDPTVSESVEKELILEHMEEDIRAQIVAALQRLDDGSFGNCAMCHNPIGKARLDTIPYTPYCVACERAIEAE